MLPQAHEKYQIRATQTIMQITIKIFILHERDLIEPIKFYRLNRQFEETGKFL